MKLNIRYLIILLIFVISCKDEPKTKGTKSYVIPTKTKVAIPEFRKDSAYYFINKQVSFGPRVPNTPEHVACKSWIVEKLKSWNIEVVEQQFEAKAYTGTILKGTNIIAIINPKASHRILLGAHWDTRHMCDHDPDPTNKSKPVLGADDGGSGVGVLMELARVMQSQTTEIGIDIVFFDCEDYGSDTGNDVMSWCLGSQHWSKNAHRNPSTFDYGILLDMVGASNPRFTIEGYSNQFAPRVVQKVWQQAALDGYKQWFVPELGAPLIDDHLFVNELAKIPMINIINRPLGSPKGFVPHWHTTKDDMSNIDPVTLQMVGNVLLKIIYREAAKEL